jgi:chromosome segregation and condensation protein ScpB
MKAFDRELDDLPEAARAAAWRGRIEAVLFAAPGPIPSATLEAIIGAQSALEPLIAALNASLAGHAVEVVAIGDGYRLQTRPGYADAIRAALPASLQRAHLSQRDGLILTVIAYMQPITRKAMASLLSVEVSRDTLARLRRLGLIETGPRSPELGAPATYVTGAQFLSTFGVARLSELPLFAEITALSAERDEPKAVAQALDSLFHALEDQE